MAFEVMKLKMNILCLLCMIPVCGLCIPCLVLSVFSQRCSRRRRLCSPDSLRSKSFPGVRGFRSKERGTRVRTRAKIPFLGVSLLRNKTESLATQASHLTLMGKLFLKLISMVGIISVAVHGPAPEPRRIFSS